MKYWAQAVACTVRLCNWWSTIGLNVITTNNWQSFCRENYLLIPWCSVLSGILCNSLVGGWDLIQDDRRENWGGRKRRKKSTCSLRPKLITPCDWLHESDCTVSRIYQWFKKNKCISLPWYYFNEFGSLLFSFLFKGNRLNHLIGKCMFFLQFFSCPFCNGCCYCSEVGSGR